MNINIYILIHIHIHAHIHINIYINVHIVISVRELCGVMTALAFARKEILGKHEYVSIT